MIFCYNVLAFVIHHNYGDNNAKNTSKYQIIRDIRCIRPPACKLMHMNPINSSYLVIKKKHKNHYDFPEQYKNDWSISLLTTWYTLITLITLIYGSKSHKLLIVAEYTEVHVQLKCMKQNSRLQTTTTTTTPASFYP